MSKLTYEEIQDFIERNCTSKRTFDVADQVPDYWKDTPEFTVLAALYNKQCQEFSDNYYKQLKEQFIYSAEDTGLTTLENSIGILPDTTLSLKDRRLNLINSLGAKGEKTTLFWLKEQLESMIPETVFTEDVDTSDFKNYAITITLRRTPWPVMMFTKKLRRQIPCNIILNLRFHRTPEATTQYWGAFKKRIVTKKIQDKR